MSDNDADKRLSYLDGLAQEGYRAYCAALSDERETYVAWENLLPIDRVALCSFAAGVEVSRDARTAPGDAQPRGRNPIDLWAEMEYPLDLPPDRMPSPGAAVRQLCAMLGVASAAPQLKHLLEDLLASGAHTAREFAQQRDALSEAKLLTLALRRMIVRIVTIDASPAMTAELEASVRDLLADMSNLGDRLSSNLLSRTQALQKEWAAQHEAETHTVESLLTLLAKI
jgi:hypothetical protein